MLPLISPEQATQRISTTICALPVETVPLSSAAGRVLRSPIVADRSIPPFDRAMMDGIALDSRSWKAGLRAFPISGTQAAGAPEITPTTTAHCIEIMTGSMVPQSCDCVVRVEDITIENGVAHISEAITLEPHQFIHSKGSDTTKGEVILESGTKLGPAELAIAASCGATTLQVSKLPNIHLITTGDEVIPPDQSPLPYQIRASHPSALRAAIEGQQLGKVTHLHLPDDEKLAKQQISDSMKQADLIVLTGGISKGKYDYVAPVLKELVGPPLFHGVAQRPGKPFAFFSSTPAVFALPGNPVSVMACMARYLLPALRKMQGLSDSVDTLPLAQALITRSELTAMVCCKVRNGALHPIFPNNSGDYRALAGSDGVAQVAPISPEYPAGTQFSFYPWL